MTLVHRRQLMDAKRIDLALRRIAAQIVEHCPDPDKLALVGVRAGGINPATRIQAYLREILERDVPLGLVDITLYRDDLADGKAPRFEQTDLTFNIEDAYVVLIDDVLFTGRTMRAAMHVLTDFGRPAVIRAAVLIDRREHRELPIQPDYWGQIVDTARDEAIEVVVGPEKGRKDHVDHVARVTGEEEVEG